MHQRDSTFALSSNNNSNTTKQTEEETTTEIAVAQNQILQVLTDPSERKYAWEVIEKILLDKRQWEEYLQIQQQPTLYQDLVKERAECIERLEKLSNSSQKLELLLKQLKPVSSQVTRIDRITQSHQEDADCHVTAMRLNQAMLKELVVGDVENGTHKPQNEPFWQTWKDQYLSGMETALPTTAHRNPFVNDKSDPQRLHTETCDTCGWSIGFSQSRFRCMDCGEVQCQPCYDHFYETFHSQCCKPDTGLKVVCETLHPSMRQIRAAAWGNLSQSMYSIVEAWGDRPCFCSWNDNGRWLSYRQVLEAALRRVTVLREVQDDVVAEVFLCFPAGSVDFYLWDLACILAGITSIGIHVPTPPEEDWPVSTRHVICKESTLRNGIPSHLQWINATVSDDVKPFDVQPEFFVAHSAADKIWTKYLTSGTTGRPKLIPQTTKQFLEEMFDSYATKKIHGIVSYLPHCWASDRGSVYWSLTHGGRVGFAPSNPSMPQIVEAMERYRPTVMSLPPAVSHFLLSLPNDEKGKPPSDLGGRLEYVSIGSGPVPHNMPMEISQKFGIRDVHEGYGITEIGGVASRGWFHSTVVNKVRLRDPQEDSDKWLDKRQEGVVGELWIGDFNTRDIVEVTHQGRKVRVIGRSSNAASFKLPNGKWCALIDIENTIMNSCPDLFKEVMVWCNRTGVLVMLGSTSQAETNTAPAMLREAMKRTKLAPEMRPKHLFLTDNALPRTITLKVQRGKIIKLYQEAADLVKANEEGEDAIEQEHTPDSYPVDVPAIAARVLGYTIDPSKSFVENGGDSIMSIQLIQQVRKELGDDALADWRSLLNDPLEGKNASNDESECWTFDAAPKPDDFAHHVLLTGATGYLGKHVLSELLRNDTVTVIVCLVRKRSKSKIKPCDRVLVVTEVPTDLKYRSVIHCAANVDHIKGFRALKADNVDMTANLLRLQLAPMIYCSTSSTKDGVAPFSDGGLVDASDQALSSIWSIPCRIGLCRRLSCRYCCPGPGCRKAMLCVGSRSLGALPASKNRNWDAANATWCISG